MLISVGAATLLFLCAFLGFRQGLRLGMQTAKGIVPPKLQPIKAIKEIITPPEDPEANGLLADHARMMAFDGFLDKERQVG